MSFMENFEKELNGMRASEGKSAVKVSNGSKSSSKSTTKKKKKKGFMDNFYDELSSIADDDIGPVYDRARNRMTVKGDAEEDDSKLDFFQKGLFEDGYQAGDITKTILGTAGDAALGVVKGVGSLVEGVADLGQYGVAGVADLLGKEDVAEEWKKSAKWNLVDSVTKDATDYLDQYSVLGRTSEAILQGVGQVGGIVATGVLGAAAGLGTAGTTALTTGVMGLSSMGSGMVEAYQSGATDEEAVTYGLISGAADALTEMMFGGLGKAVNAVGLSKGLLSADDMLAKAVSKKFSNQIAKNFAEFGVKASAEGLEEVVAGVAQAMGKKFTYMSEKDFKDILEDENLLEQFIVGSATSGMIQSGIIPGTKKGSLIEANKNESDFLTGTTKNEQAVIQKEVENRVADKEKDGKKLTKKEKAAIEEQVIRDMEKGYISTDTIEEVLGGGTYNIYKSTVDSEDAILKEYEELGQKTNATLKDQARYTELTQQVKDIREKSQRGALKSQLGQEVAELVKGDRLIESYNERARRGEAFQADLKKYDAKQQAVIQKAIDSGILNNTNRTHEFVDMVAKISADKGVLFDFTNNQKLKDSGFAVEGKQVNGYVTKDGITLNIDSKKALESTVGHEITHVLEGTEFYDSLKQTIFEYAKAKGEYQTRYDSLTELYKNIEYADIEGELTADLVGEYLFSDTDFINNLSTQNRNVFQKIYDEIKYLCKVVTAGSKEARELERVKKAFEDAYRADGKAQNDTKYSISAETDTNYLDAVNRGDNDAAQKMVDEAAKEAGYTVRGYHGTSEKFFVFDIKRSHRNNDLGDGHYFTTSEEEGRYYTDIENPDISSKIEAAAYMAADDSGYDYDDDYNEYMDVYNRAYDDEEQRIRNNGRVVNAYLRVENPFVISDDVTITVEEAHEIAKNAPKEWVRDWIYDINRNAVDGTITTSNAVIGNYSGYLSGALRKMGKYDGIIDKTVHERFRSPSGAQHIIVFDSAQVKSADPVTYDDNGNVIPLSQRFNAENKDIRYSLSDSNGRQLTAEQQEYFKDSKVRDENGNLLTVYHGSKTGGFNTFRYSKDVQTGDDYGEAFYFTSDRQKASGYSYDVTKDERVAQYHKDRDALMKRFLETRSEADKNAFLNYKLDDKDIYELMDDEDYLTEGGEVKEVYLNLKNPLIADAGGKYHYEVYPEYFEQARKNGNDGIIVKNVIDNPRGEARPIDTYIAFSPEQIKNIDNTKPTDSPDIRFSLSKPVEETKDLVALHNLTADKLAKSLELGGLPMPSLAITKADIPHSNFGDITLIFGRETIDPKANRKNKVYSADAWTPVFPRTEYESDSNVERMISQKLRGLESKVDDYFHRNLRMMQGGLEHYLNSEGGEEGLVQKALGNYGLKAAYLEEQGNHIDKVTKQEKAELGFNPDAADKYQKIMDILGVTTAEEIGKVNLKDARDNHGAEIEAIYPGITKTAMRLGKLLNIVKSYIENKDSGPVYKTVTDGNATQRAVDEALDFEGYEAWVRNLFTGIVKDSGIYNNKEMFTPSGNRRTFKQLHLPVTLENIVKAMASQNNGNAKNVSGFNGIKTLRASTAETFKSVDQMHQRKDRLQNLTQEQFEALTDDLQTRLYNVIETIDNESGKGGGDNSFIRYDSIGEILTEIGESGKYNATDIQKTFLKYSRNVSSDTAMTVKQLLEDVAQMPVNLFEAKPERVVGFDEAKVFVIPYDADVKLKQELLNRGYSIAEYDPKVEGDRQRVVNQFEEYKFSLSNVGEVPVRPNYRVTMGEDIALDGIAPTAEESSAVAKNATAQTISETETVPEVTAAEMSELFPDEGDDSQVELDNLHARSEALENRMLEMGETGDFTDLAEVNDEWMAVQARMAVLEAELAEGEADRIGSLEDADVPPEMDAPYVGRNEVTVDNPLADRNWDDVTGTKNRSVKSFMAENPDFKPYFKAEAQVMLGELMDSQKAELIYNDQLHYDSGGEQGWMGHKRLTSRSIETLLDDWGMKWDEVQRGLEAIIAGNGAENITPAKKIEFMLNERLLNGYTDFYTRKQVPPNQDYINFLNERQVNQQAQTQFDSFMETADMYAPEDIAPVLKKATPDTQAAPIFESTDPGTIKGQTTMFEPKKPPVGKTARVLTEERKVNKKTSKIWSMIQEHFLDNGMVFENVSKKTGNRELEAKWNFIRYSRGKAQRMIGEGTDGVRSLKDIKKEVDKSGKTEAFFDYLYHRHNEDRMSLDRRFGVPNKAVYGDHVTADVSRAMYTQLEKKNPEFKKWANDIYAYNKHLRNLLVENDVISKETAALWQKMYPHYVPVGRVDQDGLNINVPLDSRKTGVNNPVKRATGGNQDMRPLFNVMAERTAQTYRAIARNSFGIELKKTLGSVVEHNAQALDEVIDSIGDDNVLLKPGMNGQNPTFTVFENGERVEFEITEEMFNALKPTSEGLMYRNKILNGASSVFRGLTTQYSIPFMATNAIKDAQDVLINSQHPLRTYANFPRAQFQQLFRGKWYQEYMENGGEDNTYFDNETSDFKEDNWFMKGVKLPLKAISVANNFIEMTPRLAEYIASREAGRSVEVSMLDAARVTTNFAAGGDVTKFANANGATFLNASVQGAVQQVRNIREAHQKGLAGYLGLAARFAVAGLPAILLNNMLWDDDEEYEELADYVKQDYYVVGKYDDGKFIRIPKGRTVAVIQNAIEQVQNAATGDDEVDFGEFLKLVVNNLAPNNPLTNNILAPIGQVMSNETWYGEELVDYYMQQLPEMEQYDENTSSASIKLSQKINELTGAEISPVKIDYLLNQYSGGIGDVLLPMSTPKAEHGDDSTWGNITAPLKDKFTTDSVLNSKRSGEYKEAKNAAHKAAKSKNATDEDILRSQYFYAKSDEMSELYDQKREIQNSDLPDSEKYEKSREIQAKINAIAEEALSDNANVDIDGYYATVGDKRFDYSDFNGRWYEIEGEYLEREQNAIKRYGITPSDYWNDTDLYYHADYYFTYSPELETVSRNVFEGKWFAGYAAEVSQIKGDDLNGDGKTDSGTKKKKVFSYIEGLDIDDIEKKILRKMSYPSEDDYNYEIIDYLNSRSDISYEDKKTILEALDFTVDSEGYIEW